MSNRPISDTRELVKAEVAQCMKSYVVYNAEEHDQTRAEFKDLRSVVINQKQGVRLTVHEVLLFILFIGMGILLTGC